MRKRLGVSIQLRTSDPCQPWIELTPTFLGGSAYSDYCSTLLSNSLHHPLMYIVQQIGEDITLYLEVNRRVE